MTHPEGVFQLWNDAADGGNLGWVTAERLHDQWLRVLRISRSYRPFWSQCLEQGCSHMKKLNIYLKSNFIL